MCSMFLCVCALADSEFNGFTFTNGQYITTYIDSSIAQYSGNVSTYRYAWNVCPEINVVSSNSVNANIVFYGSYSVTNQGVAYTTHPSANKAKIYFYKPFVSLDTVDQNETIVHEIGHALGLAHCISSYNSLSVMRDTGFNHYAAPLYHDRNNISIIY